MLFTSSLCEPIALQKLGGKPMAIDPVCGMEVDEQTAAGKSEYEGKTYYFCSLGCKAAFDKDPEKYLQQESGGHQRDHHA
jgi:YHS domain-containing protein